jgi:hypothetical protein
MNIQALQRRFPWIMTPFVLLDVLLTPRRWACGLERIATAASNALVVDSTGLSHSLMRLLNRLSPLRTRLLSGSRFLMRVDWEFRKFFWTFTWAFVVVVRLWPRKIPIPVEQKPIRLISAPESYGDFASPLLVVPSDVPCAEHTLPGAMSVQMLHLMQDIYPVIASHQPVAATEPAKRVRHAFPWIYGIVRSAPVWHPDLAEAVTNGNLLSVLAVGGPFAKLLEKSAEGDGRYEIDLRYLGAFPVREELSQLGCRIHFRESQGVLRESRIEYQTRITQPGASDWPFVHRIALCTLLTHTTVWRHGMQYHVAGIAPFAPLTHNLPPAHPLRRLLAPHIAETLSTNFHTHLTLRRSGFDVTGFSFSYATILNYYNEGARTFDIARLDPRVDIQRKRLPDTLTFPYRDQALMYFDLFESYVRRYIDHYYVDDEQLQSDVAVQMWFDSLDRYIIGGLRGYVPELTKAGLIKLCTLFIYSVTVEHEENTMWDYAVFLPATVHADGTDQTVGEVQSVMNFQLVISSATNRLMADFTHLALDEGAAAIMRDFQSSLHALQTRMENEPDRYWRIYPADLEASVSA